MGHREVRIEFQCLFVVSYGCVIATLEIVNPTVVGIDNQRQRIEFPSPLDVRQRLRISSNQCEAEPEAVMRGGIASIERERAFVFGNAFFPLPLEGVDLCHRPMSLSQRAVKLDSFSCGRLQLRYGLTRGHRNVPDGELVRLGQITISQSVTRIDLYSLLKKLNRLQQAPLDNATYAESPARLYRIDLLTFENKD